MKRINRCLTVGLIITGIILVIALLGIIWTPYDPNAMSASEKLSSPSLSHPMGTDNFGRDIFSRVMKGTGTTFLVSAISVAIGALLGIAIGAVTGYYGGIVDDILTRITDTLTAFPSILLALVVIGILGPGNIYNLIISLSIVFIPSFARMARSAFASVREKNYIISARLMGVKTFRILVVHMLPNTRDILLPSLTIGFTNAVLAEASMSYLGIGVTPPNSSLGYMLSEAQSYLTSAPWYAICTGVMIIFLVFGVGLIGEGIQAQEVNRNAHR